MRANKRYSQTVSKSFHLSQACLDLSQTPDDEDVQVQVLLTSDNENHILCTLDRKSNLQAPLDLMFSEGDDIAFSCVGMYTREILLLRLEFSLRFLWRFRWIGSFDWLSGAR